MNILAKKNFFILFTGLALISAGFVSMKLEPAEYGYGFLALTLAPLLVLTGFGMGVASIFYGTNWLSRKKQEISMILVGWAAFLISLMVYILTLEGTASLWDCGEFIACAYKLQVPHPPGAPLFLMIGRLFSFISMGDLLRVAYWINMSSAVCSAFSVMFTFWAIVMLARKIKPESGSYVQICSGLVGAFSIAVADSFWFSAVEAETYAMATCFLIICFWSVLKWERIKDEDLGNKWIIFIFFLLGLSVGVHPMSLLILPALAVVIFFKNRRFSRKLLAGSVLSGAVSILILNHAILFGLPDATKYFDIFFVNMLGTPFYTGAVFILVLVCFAGYYVYVWSIRRKQKNVSIAVTGLMYLLIGYSSYFMILIRSQADPSVDEHNPENLISFASYLKRSSYGTRPLLYGPDFTSKIKSYRNGNPVYTKSNDRYRITDYTTEYEYEKHGQTIFPRMYSNRENHISTYKKWTGIGAGEQPRFLHHLLFMFKYQLGHMYFRYLMFNFSGRESDIQDASWMGFWHLSDPIPDVVKDNKARNNFFALPFLLGIAGMIFQFRKDKKGFWSLMAFFLFLGLILAFYLNSTPNEPRERDYIYVGSYLAFAIWMGLGVLGIYHFLEKNAFGFSQLKYAAVLTIAIPFMMFAVGLDDHNRSGRTLQVDHARNTLASCAPNSILFTGGDNDTFPLWYVQEVENFRTDVRVIVLSYFNGDWYIDQMQRKVYDSDPLPFSLGINNYRQGGLNDVLPYVEHKRVRGPIHLTKFIELIRNGNKSLQVALSGNRIYNSIPSKTFYLNIDKAKIIRSDIVPKGFENLIPEKMHMAWNGNYLEKSALMALDLIATNQWHRPIYFNVTSLNSISLDLKKHVVQEGLVYRLLPVHLEHEGAVNTTAMYSNLMEKWKFHDLNNENTYYNHEDYQLRILQSVKSSYNSLARAMLKEGNNELAGEVVGFLYSNFIKENIELDVTLIETTELLFDLEENDKAIHLADQLYTKADQVLTYLSAQNEVNSMDWQIQLFTLRQLSELGARYDFPSLSDRCSNKFLEFLVYQ